MQRRRLCGLKKPSKGATLLILVVVCLCLLPILSLLNNILYGDSYIGSRKLSDDYIAHWEDDDPRLISHIKEHYLVPPVSRKVPYNLVDARRKYFSQKKQDAVVAELVKRKRNGFFIEAGAYDGETYSNTLYFERELNWTGLLVEPDYVNRKRLLTKGRKAWVLEGCLEGSRRPKKLRMYGAMEVGTLEEYMTFSRWFFTKLWRPVGVTEVWCFPLAAVMRAIGRMQIDYFVLDVEGAEMSVLKALPMDVLDIGVMQVEYSVFSGAFWDRDESEKRLHDMREFFHENLPKYQEYRTIALDIIYVKRNYSSAGHER